MKKIILFLFYGISVFGQDVVEQDPIAKTNPIIFTECYFGLYGGSNGGLTGFGLNLNYQFKKNDLLTARFNLNSGFMNDYLLISPVTPLPFSVREETQVEFAILYGKRWAKNNFSFSVSSGISHVERDYYQNNGEFYENLNQSYFGVPFEFNIKWFKSKKSRFRAYYGLIPIGKKKVSFGRSVGFKLIGNIAKNDYVGLAFTYGFGWHKKY